MDMIMKHEIRCLFTEEGIGDVCAVPFSRCRLLAPEKLGKYRLNQETAKTAVVFLVPYYAGDADNRNISVYAAARDYHLYFADFFARACRRLETMFPGYVFSGSADNAPIDERHAAAIAGLGIFGDNGLIISERYGTYVFIGEILTDLPTAACYDGPEADFREEDTVVSPGGCSHCGACRRACPMGNNPFSVPQCLSEVTQTKRLETLCASGRTVSDYEAYIRYYGSAWGCDRCQTACPHNRAPQITPIPFFREALLPSVTAAQIAAMDDEQFQSRAYAWRKRPCIMRNLTLLEQDAAAGLPSAAIIEQIRNAVKDAAAVMRAAHDVEAQKDAIDEKAGPANFVTVYDVRIQNLLMEALHTILPEAQFFAEEKENDPAILREGYTFIIDPIDGTTNFIHNWGISAISVGLLWRGVPVVGMICDPYRDELYEARLGLGATCNGHPIHVSDRPVERGVFAVGTAPYYRETLGDRTFAMMRHLFDAGVDIRRLGSAALDLAAVACGRADGYVELLISPWDYAAGALLVTEAGGVVTDLSGVPMQYGEPSGICAGTPLTHGTLLDACRM